MQIAALLIIGGRAGQPAHNGNGHGVHPVPEQFAGLPIALLDVLGRPVVNHVIARLSRAGVCSVSVLYDRALEDSIAVRDAQQAGGTWIAAENPWDAAEDEFSEYARQGVENILAIRLGPYVEFDVADLLAFHESQRQRVTQLCSPARTLDVVVIDANRRNEAATLFRSRLAKSRTPSSAYLFGGYSNGLENVRDLRCLAQDGLLMRCELQPEGSEIKPGVWTGEEVRIHRTARLLAPCFVGSRAKVRANAVVTRCSSLEHHAEVDCGTVVEDSSVLPYTYLGTGLDVAHAVVGFQQLAHLKRKTQVEISDPRLVATVSSSAPLRTLQSAAALAGYVPLQFVRGIFKWSRRPERPASGNCPDVLPALQTSALRSSSSRDETEQFSANLAVVRRYGDQ